MGTEWRSTGEPYDSMVYAWFWNYPTLWIHRITSWDFRGKDLTPQIRHQKIFLGRYLHPQIIYSWLVVSNMAFIVHNIWDNPSHWRTSYFSRWLKHVKTTNQTVVLICDIKNDKNADTPTELWTRHVFFPVTVIVHMASWVNKHPVESHWWIDFF